MKASICCIGFICFVPVDDIRCQSHMYAAVGAAATCSLWLLYAAAARTSPTDETPAQLLVLCKRMAALCSLELHINSSSYSSSITALDALALAELTALTSLQLTLAQEADDDASQQRELLASELSPLTRLTALQQLSIHSWQPLGAPRRALYHIPLPAAVQAAAGVRCLPAALTSLQLHSMDFNAIVKWLPSVLTCTGLQHLHMHANAGADAVDHIMTGCAQHLTGKYAETSLA
jgi:hypothetical protein